MKYSLRALAAAAMVATGSLANAAVLDFNSTVVAATVPGKVPIIADLGNAGFVDDFYRYDGFKFDFQYLGGTVPVNHAWIWLREGSSAMGGLEQVYQSGNAGNGFLAHGCLNANCSPVSSNSMAITSNTPFYLQSLDVARYFADGLTIQLYTNISDSTPAASFGVGATTADLNYVPQTLLNPHAGTAYSKMIIQGYQGYYGVDNIVYAPVPEASTYAMMALGLVGLGAVVRRRQSKAA